MSHLAERRVQKELLELQRSTENGDNPIEVFTVTDNLMKLHGTIVGPPDTPYAGGLFKLEINIPETYPFFPPKVKFITKIWHPNISSATGVICLDILKDQWAAAMSLRTMLLSIQALLASPEPNDPQDAVVAKQFQTNRNAFNMTAKHWASIYANGPSRQPCCEEKVDKLMQMGFSERQAMDNILISDAERFYIIQGTQLGCRLDGRRGNDYRPMELETSILNHTSGSARVKIGSTIVIACVSVEIGSPSLDRPNEGRIEIDVECSPTATPRFSGKSGAAIADTLKAILSTAFTPNCLPFKSFCVRAGKQCWLLESDGNLLDAASLAIVAALSTIKLPLSLTSKIAADSEHGSACLSVNDLPVFVTVHKVGNAYIVDASREEEACSLSRVLVGVRSSGTVTVIIKEGCGSLQTDTLLEMVEFGQTLGKEMHSALKVTLEQELRVRSGV